mgnify:CR=1 FL=1
MPKGVIFSTLAEMFLPLFNDFIFTRDGLIMQKLYNNSEDNANALRSVTARPLTFILSPRGRGLGEGDLVRM